VRRKRVVTDPHHLLLGRFSDKQFCRILAYLPDTPSNLDPKERFLAAARLAYPKFTARHLAPGPGRRQPSDISAWMWNSFSPADQQYLMALDTIRRILRVNEALFPITKVA
jgi:hypothetical protein